MTLKDFIDVLQQRRLVSENVLRQLRQKAEQDEHRLTSRSVLKYLVQKGLVSNADAKALLSSVLDVDARTESSILGYRNPPQRDGAKEKTPSARREPIGGEGTRDADSGQEPPNPAPGPEGERRRAAGSGPADQKSRQGDDDRGESSIPRAISLGDLASDESTLGGQSDADQWSETGAAVLSPKEKKGNKKKKSSGKKKKNEWDSPLLLLGGGGLFVLVTAGLLLWFLLRRENAEDVWKLANESFESGNYTRAIETYKQFVEYFPSHPDHSKAKVRLGMTRLRQATEGSSDFSATLKTALQVIADIEDEPAFASDGDEEGLSQAKREMSTLLTRIAKGLADKADQTEDPNAAAELVKNAEEAIALCQNTKYIPQRLRLDSDLAALRDTLERVDVRRQRDADLASTLAEIDAALADRDVVKAFAAHKSLTHRHAVLGDNAALVAKVAEITEAERAVVRLVSETKAAVEGPRESPLIATVAFASQSIASPAEAKGVMAIQVDGSLWGIRLADGALLWRQFVGGAANQFPVTLDDQTLCAVDARHNEVLAIRRDTGKILWRTHLGEKLQQPAFAAQRILVGTTQGKLFSLDPVTGEAAGFVQFSQPLAAPPVADPAGRRIYAIGEHSNVYTLAADTLECAGVYYLGHEKGSVAVGPALVLNKIVIAENSGAQTCHVRALSIDNQGIVAKQIAMARIDGRVVTPLLTTQRRVTALSSQGAVGIFEIGAGDDQGAMTALASRKAAIGAPRARFGAITNDGKESHLWIGGSELSKLAILPTGSQLPVRSLDDAFEGDAFDYPLLAEDGLLVHVRRVANQSGVRIAATDVADSRTRWQTSLAVPAVGSPVVYNAGKSVGLGLESGDVFRPDRQALARRVDSVATSAPHPASQKGPCTSSLDLGDGEIVVATHESPQLLIAKADAAPVKLLLPAPAATPPVRWGPGFAIATKAGQVHIFDRATNKELAQAFQPRQTADAKVAWVEPTVVGAAPDELLVVSDGIAEMYALKIVERPTPRIDAVLSGMVGDRKHTTRLAAAGKILFVGDEAQGLALYDLGDLKPINRVAMGAAITWGPFSVGEEALVGLESGEIALVDATGAIRWRLPAAQNVPVGHPLLDEASAADRKAWIAYRRGALVQVDLATGNLVQTIPLDEWTASGPVAFGKTLALTSSDGSLLFLNRP